MLRFTELFFKIAFITPRPYFESLRKVELKTYIAIRLITKQNDNHANFTNKCDRSLRNQRLFVFVVNNNRSNVRHSVH